MKRDCLGAAFLLIVFGFVMVACGDNDNAGAPAPNTSPSPAPVCCPNAITVRLGQPGTDIDIGTTPSE